MRSIDDDYRAVLDALDSHIALLDGSGIIIAVNAAWESYARLNGAEGAGSWVGTNYLDASCPNAETDPFALAAREGVVQVLAGARSTFTLQYPCHAPGEERWFLLEARPLRHANGGAIVIHSDVTVTYLAHEQVRYRQRRFASLIEHAVDLITVIDVDGTITYKSPGFEHTLGYSLAEAVGTDAFAFVHPEDLPLARRIVDEVSTTDFGSNCQELRLRHRDGSWRWCETTMTNLLNDPDVRGIVVNSRDITERKVAEAAIAERAESFSTLFNGSAEAMVIHDGDAFVAVNRAYAEMIGLEADQIVGRGLLEFVAPASHALATDRIQQGSEVPYDLIARRADGSTVPVELLGRRIRYENRWLRLLTVRDVTQRRQAEEALRISEARFRDLVQEASEIVIVFDATGVIRYANPALERVLGHPVESYAGGLRLDIVHIDDREAVVRTWAAVTASPGAQMRITYRCMNADGAWVWLEGIATNLIDSPAVGGVVLNARDVSDQKRLESDLRHLALHDPLTGLPNRTLLADRMDYALLQATQRGDLVAILFLDLDYFKNVNDAFGHAAGDILLRAVAGRLNSALRLSDTLARVGGDEFIVLLPNIQHERDAQVVADRVQVAMAAPFTCQGRDVEVGVTIGIAISDPGQATSDILLRDGDAALYSAKRAGRGRSIVYAEGMTGNATRRWKLETDLRHAAAKGEFVLHYQPIISLDTGRVGMVEALIRWQHPRYGLVPADEFIPIAERAGHIVAIGRWVIDEVCRQLAVWGDDAPAIAVNLSAAQFIDPALVQHIAATAAAAGIDPRKLRVEITEHMLIEDLTATAATLNRLRELGVRVAIDDFGTGYSSLRYLRELPVDAIKLDRSFIHGLESSAGAVAIVEGITSLAHAIGLAVTAEGIETEGQLAHLQAIGCDRGQGYLLGKPMPATAEAPGRARSPVGAIVER